MEESNAWVELKAYPTPDQERLLEYYQEALSRLRHMWLEERKNSNTNFVRQSRDIRNIRKQAAYKPVPTPIIKGTLWSMEKANREGNDDHRRVNSLEFGSTGWKIEDNKVLIGKLGELRFRGTIPSSADKLSLNWIAGSWFIYLRTDRPLTLVSTPIYEEDKAIGVDLGVRWWSYLSNGKKCPQHESLHTLRAALKKHQKSLTRKETDTPRFKENQRRIQKTKRRIIAAQQDRAIKHARWLCKNYEVICLEEINKEGAGIANHPIYRDAAKEVRWDFITDAITKEAARTGTTLVMVPAFFTSQTCSGCGWYVKKVLEDRQHNCKRCGLRIDRDLNAAIVIKQRGLMILRGERKAKGDWHPPGWKKAS